MPIAVTKMNHERDEVTVKQVDDVKATERPDFGHKFGTVGWGPSFIWVGIAYLAKLDIGVGFLGIGIMALGMQVVRKLSNLRLEGSGVVVGLLFASGRP